MGLKLSRINDDEQILQNNLLNKRKSFTGSLIFKRLIRTKDKVHFHGNHETHVYDGSEGELHTRNIVCEKSPGHTKFIPVHAFTIEHLPECRRDIDLLEYIRTAADLTVLVNVKVTSPYRPEFWPETNNPYPFYRCTTGMRTGTGMMHKIEKFTDGVNRYGGKHLKNVTKCWCATCQHSHSPSNEWWEFNVITATHVVFDDIEAGHTALRLFYDDKEKDWVKVDNVSIVSANPGYDVRKLKCVTCKKSLEDKLDKMWNHYDDVWWKVCKKYQKVKAVDTLIFIVSHTHGCYKQISIGQMIKKMQGG